VLVEKWHQKRCNKMFCGRNMRSTGGKRRAFKVWKIVLMKDSMIAHIARFIL